MKVTDNELQTPLGRLELVSYDTIWYDKEIALENWQDLPV